MSLRSKIWRISHKLKKKIRRSPFFSQTALVMVTIASIIAVFGVVVLSVILNGEDSIKSPKHIEKWPDLLMTYKNDPSTNQLLFVKCVGESPEAEASYYVKSDEGRWEMLRSATVFIGANGLGKKREGDKKTPEGDFNVTGAFGIKPNPGSAFDYIQITPYTVACDEDCPFYNQIIDIRQTGAYDGEQMMKCAPQYNYGMTIDFNPDNVYPKGSNIFLHCVGSNHSTAGCIAMEEAMMFEIMTTATAGFKVCIHEK